MARVLVDRPRSGMRLRARRGKAHQDACRWFDDSPRREPMSRGRGTKCLSENFSPLERYLRSQVGRPWDAIYSEISAHLRPSNAVQQHVRDHLADFVATCTWLEDGRVVAQLRWGNPIALADAGWTPRFYVCPRTGLLREWVRKAHPPEQRDPGVRWDGPWRQLRRIDSIWYALQLAPIPQSPAERARARDCFLGSSLAKLLRTRDGELLRASYGRRGVYAEDKRQLGKRELRRIDALPLILGGEER